MASGVSGSIRDLHRPTWAEIDLDALVGNLAVVRSRTGPRPILAVVKADAYGHGAARIARTFEEEGIAWLGVALPEEGVELREAGVGRPIFVLGGFAPPQADLLLAHQLTPAIYRPDQVEALARAASNRGIRAAAHIKIDSGMGRLGVPAADLSAFLAALQPWAERIEIEGVFSHLSVADDPRDPYTTRQISVFHDAVETIRQAGMNPSLIHLANSAAVIDHPPAWLTLVRPGLILYGYPPSDRMSAVSIHPVLSLRSRIIYVKEVPKGTSIGYGRTFIAERDCRIATLAIGYDDGLPRLLSNRGHILLGGRRAPIVGRISMDLTTVDISHLDGVALGDEAILLGSAGEEHLGADLLATWAGTIPWEILCGIGSRVPRLYRRADCLEVRSRFAKSLA